MKRTSENPYSNLLNDLNCHWFLVVLLRSKLVQRVSEQILLVLNYLIEASQGLVSDFSCNYIKVAKCFKAISACTKSSNGIVGLLNKYCIQLVR